MAYNPNNPNGQATMANSEPVVIASNQSAVPVSDGGSTLSIDDGGSTISVDGTVTVQTITNALPSGNNNIGDVDILSIAAGTNTIGDVGVKPRTSGGLTPYHLVGAASTNATVVKSAAGQLFGWYLYNGGAAAIKVTFHNTASAPTAGASVFFSIMIPPGAAANAFSEIGIAFSAGIAITTVTGIADNNTTAIAASELIINLFYA